MGGVLLFSKELLFPTTMDRVLACECTLLGPQEESWAGSVTQTLSFSEDTHVLEVLGMLSVRHIVGKVGLAIWCLRGKAIPE